VLLTRKKSVLESVEVGKSDLEPDSLKALFVKTCLEM